MFFWILRAKARATGWARRWAVAGGLALVVISLVVAASDTATAAVDPNLFVDELVDELPSQTTAGEWMPDGRLLVLGRNGVIAISNPQTGATTTLMTVANVSNAGERGALDLALHPDFANNSQFFVYHATNAEPSRLRIISFTLNENDAAAMAASYSLIWENPGPAHTTQFHIGGSLEISGDDKLLLTIGDGLISTQADDLNNVFGKTIRLELDGAIPADNPFVDGTGPNLDEIFATGLRNPFRSWVDPLNGDHWVGDVGGNTAVRAYEEINVVTAGGFYGWPACEGPLGQPKNGPDCPAGTIAPWHYYDHDSAGGCCLNRSITLGEKYRGNQLPVEMAEAFIYGDWAESKFFWVEATPGGQPGAVHEIPAVTDARPVWISVGPDGHIYYIRYNPFAPSSFELRRLRYTGTVDQPPTITQITATPDSGPTPLVATFGSDAADIDGDPITYAWSFGDGATSTDPNPTHTYTSAGAYTASLVVTANGETATAPSIIVQAGVAPQVTITSPIDASTFQAGQQLTLDAAGSDADGTLTDTSYAWTIDLLHDEHAHGVFLDQPGQTQPFDIATTGHDYRGDTGYLLTVTVTDSDGLTASDTVTILPEKVDLTFANNLGGGTVLVDGTTQLAPYLLDTAIGFEHSIDAPSPLCINNTENAFASWSDGGAQTHTIVVPATDATYTATYSAGPQCVPCGTTWEAEAGTDVVAGFQVASDATASNGNYLHVPDNTLGNMLTPPNATTPTIEYCIDIPYDGTWYLDGDVATVDLAGNSNSFYLQVDANPWQPWKYADSLAWFTATASNDGPRHEWNLAAGMHTLRLGFREDGAKIDQFTFKTDDPPPGPPPNVIINEFRYAPEADRSEFIEVMNADSIAVDISGWSLGTHATALPGTVLAPGEQLVFAENIPALLEEFPGASLATIQSFEPAESLDDAGEAIELRTAEGALVEDVSYLPTAPWPTAGGDGATLERTDPADNAALATSWTASHYGTPGAQNGPVLCGGFAITIDLNATPSAPGTSGDDVILGTPGNDVITALEGNDVVCAGDGDDVVNGGVGDDTLFGEAGADMLFGLAGADVMFGGSEADDLIGFGGADQLHGENGGDTLNGGPDDDVVHGGAGADSIFGQGGNDTLEGGDAADLIIGSDGLDSIVGGAGDDTLNGGPDADTIFGGSGNDTIFGLTGDDLALNGDVGDDMIFGQLGADQIDGGPGNDLIWGNEDNDVITDPSGTNVINGGPGDDMISGGIDNDTIYGDGSLLHEGNDTIDGGAGTDQLFGFAGDDIITADDGEADTVNAGPNGPAGDSCTSDAGLDTVFNCNP